MQLLEHTATEPSPIIRVLNYVAAALGVGTFLNLVNLAVGLLSAVWLASQIWAHWKYALPYKRLQLELARQKLAGRVPQEESDLLDSKKGDLS